MTHLSSQSSTNRCQLNTWTRKNTSSFKVSERDWTTRFHTFTWRASFLPVDHQADFPVVFFAHPGQETHYSHQHTWLITFKDLASPRTRLLHYRCFSDNRRYLENGNPLPGPIFQLTPIFHPSSYSSFLSTFCSYWHLLRVLLPPGILSTAIYKSSALDAARSDFLFFLAVSVLRDLE